MLVQSFTCLLTEALLWTFSKRKCQFSAAITESYRGTGCEKVLEAWLLLYELFTHSSVTSMSLLLPSVTPDPSNLKPCIFYFLLWAFRFHLSTLCQVSYHSSIHCAASKILWFFSGISSLILHVLVGLYFKKFICSNFNAVLEGIGDKHITFNLLCLVKSYKYFNFFLYWSYH